MTGKKVNQHVVELLLLRPMEPLFIPKGENKVVFDIPPDYLAEEFKNCRVNVQELNAVEGCIHVKIKVVNPPASDQFAFAKKMNRYDQLSDFFPEHQKLVSDVTDVFHNTKDFGDFLSLAAYARDNININVFTRAFSTAVLYRDDMKGIQLPAIFGSDPFKFFPSEVMSRVKEQASVMGAEMRPVDLPETASNRDPEHRMAYFREDIGVNSHHWKWHLVYPNLGSIERVKKDRRGELFYYMHQQLIARYNADRLCNQLGKVRRFNDFKEVIPEAYFPKMGDRTSMKNYPARHANSVLRDINYKSDDKGDFVFDISMLDIWRSRIYEAIDTGSVRQKDGTPKELTTKDGIDVIGNLLESSTLSVNQAYYGNLHAYGHIACGVIHDPDYAHLERFSVMGDVATACRDPFFYRWHAMVDDLCQHYKKTLPAYQKDELGYQGIKVTHVGIVERENASPSPATPSKKHLSLNTFWMKDYVDVANGLDFLAANKSMYVAVKHLQYGVFDYNISVINEGEPRYGTVRIFIAPKLDEDGRKMSFNYQRTSFIEMDKFMMYFANGPNTFKRCSCASSVTVLAEDTFRSFGAPPKGDLTEKQEAEYFCGCGWPNHMLVPKGTCEGMYFDLFVMISNFEGDNIGQSIPKNRCGAPSYCGIRDKEYPDKRAMGFPFDRILKDGSEPDSKPDDKKTLKEWANDYSNMTVSDLVIKFANKTVVDQKMKEKLEADKKCSAGQPVPIAQRSAPVREYDPCNPEAGLVHFGVPPPVPSYYNW